MVSQGATPELTQSDTVLSVPSFMPHRYRPGGDGSWSGHLAFANDLIASTRPALILEYGTYLGESYFGFCQSVVENRLSCRCYAVSTNVNTVLDDVAVYNERNYAAFSYLIRNGSSIEAWRQFSDETIDLLHLDGSKGYEKARSEFELWFPKVRAGGIVLLHDTAIKDQGFGVWRLWEEIEATYPQTFSFHHSCGLGVLRKQSTQSAQYGILQYLFLEDKAALEQVRRLYVLYADHLENVFLQTCMSPLTEMQAELKSAQSERVLLGVQVAQLIAERNRLRDELTRTEQLLQETLPYREQAASLGEALKSVQTNYEDEKATRMTMQQSRSWRITAPLRRFLNRSKDKARS